MKTITIAWYILRDKNSFDNNYYTNNNLGTHFIAKLIINISFSSHRKPSPQILLNAILYNYL